MSRLAVPAVVAALGVVVLGAAFAALMLVRSCVGATYVIELPRPAAASSPARPAALRWFADRRYFVDAARLKARNWRLADVAAPTTIDGGVVFEATLPSDKADDVAPAIRLVVQAWPQFTEREGDRAAVCRVFRNWGKSIRVWDLMQLCTCACGDWRLTASDVLKTQTQDAVACELRPALCWAHAVGTDRESKRRERREWFAWAIGAKPFPITYLAEFTVADPDSSNDTRWTVDVPDLMRNIAAAP